MMPKFNAKIKFKLSSRWFKYVDIKKLNNNGQEIIKLLDIIPPYNTFFDVHIENN